MFSDAVSITAISTNKKTSVLSEVFSLYKRESYKRESKPHCPSFAKQKGHINAKGLRSKRTKRRFGFRHLHQKKTSVFAEVFSLNKRKSYKRESKPHCPSFAKQKGEKLGLVFPTVGAIHESPVNFDVILRNASSVVPYS